MQITIIETSSLGDRSYLISDGHAAVVIAPTGHRPRVLTLAEECGTIIITCWRRTSTLTTSLADWSCHALWELNKLAGDSSTNADERLTKPALPQQNSAQVVCRWSSA
jgi:hypothetical protein